MRISALVLFACSASADRVQPIRNTPHDAGVADASLVEQQGVGNCTRDDECELTTWARGCCQGACRSYSINKRELAARKSSESCTRAAACPPEVPCPADSYHVVAAKCSHGKCVSVLQLIAPALDPAF